ncbi:tlde1 domain-containing protein [Paraburkholderia sejongensis]|uniref:tlde1 domain-containing protein n=1 Tax=Paraburkholderia sejongensis TaxID=2886946 RepID=UPI0022A8514E|nr:tlde1 domain-containing protein [Paraburkholderia sp. MMS20-SJTR3]
MTLFNRKGKRGHFRLHPLGGQGISQECITLPDHDDFRTIRNSLLHSSTVPVRTSGLSAYGTIEVIAHGETCP